MHRRCIGAAAALVLEATTTRARLVTANLASFSAQRCRP
jgi:hypothetical protein